MNTRLGLQDNVLATIGYIIPLIAIIAYFTEQENNFVRFHSLQSIFLSLIVVLLFSLSSGVSCFLSFLPNVGGMLSCICSVFLIPISLGILGIMIFLAVKAYNREHYKLPLIGDQVERIIYKY